MKDPKLTLKLDPEGHYVDLNTFVDALGYFRRMLNGLRQITTQEGKPLEWLVTDLQVGSAVAAVEPKDDAVAGFHAAQVVMDGLQALERSEVPPPAFSEDSIQAAKALVEITGRAKVRSLVSGAEQRLEITSKTMATAVQLLDTAVWEDFGTIEGSLEMVTLRDRYQCNVYEAITGRKVPCHFKRGQLDTVRAALGERVCVTGLVRYNRHGQVLSMRAEDFVIIPSDARLPTIDELAGIDPGFTGGLSAEEYVRRLRNDD